MTRIIRSGVLAMLILSVAMMASFPAAGQEGSLAGRESELLELVRQLQERIGRLETRIQSLEVPAEGQAASPEAQELTERVEKLEESAAERRESSSSSFVSYWKDGLRFETADQRHKLRIGGRIQWDTAFFEQNGFSARVPIHPEDGTEFRRLRLFVKGETVQRLEYKLQLDFAGGDVDLNDVYLAFKDVRGVGTVMLGHFKEPFSLEQLTSSNNITFMERSLIDSMAPGRNAGIMLNNHVLDNRLTWAIGAFRETDDQGRGLGDGRYNLTARITGLPWYEDDGRKLVHLGANYSFRNTGFMAIRSRPESHLSGVVISTGMFPVNNVNAYGGELAFVHGPFSVQAEYIRMSTDTNIIFLGNHDFSGFYVMGSYFVTGEHRPYSLSNGAFGAVRPKRPFRGEEGGWGALELALRYSKIDLSDGLISGGEEENFTVGVNWYLNPNIRLMWNYVHAEIDRHVFDGDLNIFQTRLQVTF